MPSFWKIGHAAGSCINCLQQVLWLAHSVKNVPGDIDLIFFYSFKLQSIIFVNISFKLLFPFFHKCLEWEFFYFFPALLCLELNKPQRHFFLKFYLSFGNLMFFEYFHFKFVALAKHIILQMLIFQFTLLLFSKYFITAAPLRFRFSHTLKLMEAGRRLKRWLTIYLFHRWLFNT